MLKTTFSRGALAAFVTLAGFAFAGQPALSAENCPRGQLDERFCDRDGDLTADTPTDASKQLDPDTLIFAYTPVEVRDTEERTVPDPSPGFSAKPPSTISWLTPSSSC